MLKARQESLFYAFLGLVLDESSGSMLEALCSIDIRKQTYRSVLGFHPQDGLRGGPPDWGMERQLKW